jgi:hypothetical protein
MQRFIFLSVALCSSYLHPVKLLDGNRDVAVLASLHCVIIERVLGLHAFAFAFACVCCVSSKVITSHIRCLPPKETNYLAVQNEYKKN